MPGITKIHVTLLKTVKIESVRTTSRMKKVISLD